MSHVKLSKSEREAIMADLRDGKKPPQIAREHGVSETSVRMIRQAAMGAAARKAVPIIERATVAGNAAQWRAKAYASRRFGGDGYVK